jgi:hypothetical protein
LHRDNAPFTLPFSPGNFFYQKEHDSRPSHATLISVSSIEYETERSGHFDTTEVFEAESQAMLVTLTEHGFQDAFKKTTEALGTVHTHGRGLL